MELRILDPLTSSGWDRLVQSAANGTIFHCRCWLRVLTEAYHYRPLGFLLQQGEAVLALIPVMEIRSGLTGRRGVSLPFSDVCPPLHFAETDSAAMETAVAGILEHGKRSGWKYFELRGDAGGGSEGTSAEYRYHTLTLKGRSEEDLFRGFKENTRRNIRKSLNEPLEVRFSGSREAVETFFDLQCRNRRHFGLPPQPFSFFELLRRHVFEAGYGQVALAFRGRKAAAAHVYLHFGTTATYKYGASDPSQLECRPNHRLMWEAIRQCAREGIERFSFGRSDPDNGGLIRYKEGWGAVTEGIRYHRYPLGEAAAARKSGTPGSLSLFRLLPLPLLRWSGSILYRHFG